MAFVTAHAAAQAAAAPAEQTTLAGLRDRARPVLVFAPRADDARLLRQTEEFRAHAAELKERDVVVITACGSGSAQGGTAFSEQEQVAARARFHVSAGAFTVVLVGKDGGEKLRTHALLTAQELDRVIDAMPMRRDEMERQGGGTVPGRR